MSRKPTDAPNMRSQAQRDAVHRAAARSAVNRKQRALEARERAARRAEQLTPGHHETCVCDLCEAARTRMTDPDKPS